MDPSAVPRFYSNNPVDLFLNVSESEGIPVSIMEAMAAGIPVIATDVGGSAEIVDDSVGTIVPADTTAESLAKSIATFRDIPRARSLEMREACRRRIERDYDQSRNAKAVAEVLRHITDSAV
jgi:glycosyltransferase involved in cell wall biosynthesis